MQQQAEKQNLSIFQIITLASVLEKETGSTLAEKKTVAGIFYNRLKTGMPLQSDATVNYATKKICPAQPKPTPKLTLRIIPINTQGSRWAPSAAPLRLHNCRAVPG